MTALVLVALLAAAAGLVLGRLVGRPDRRRDPGPVGRGAEDFTTTWVEVPETATSEMVDAPVEGDPTPLLVEDARAWRLRRREVYAAMVARRPRRRRP